MPTRPILDDLLARLPDENTEAAIAPILRRISEEERRKILDALVDNSATAGAGLRLAVRTLETPALLEHFFGRAIEICNASSARVFLGPYVSRLGIRRTFRILRDRLQNDPLAVRKARYWLPSMLPRDNPQAVEYLFQLDQDLQAAENSQGDS